MFNIGGGELLVIGLVALIVLGPQRLPHAARQAGKVLGDLRRLSTGFQTELRDAFVDADSPTAGASGRRELLTRPPEPNGSVGAAVSSVSGQPPARRAPLRAEPAPAKRPAAKKPTPAKATASRAGRATTATSKVTAKKASPPRSKGS